MKVREFIDDNLPAVYVGLVVIGTLLGMLVMILIVGPT